MYLGIDLGTSSVKALACNGEGRMLAQAAAALEVHSRHPHWSEQDPADWWSACIQAVRALPPEVREGIRGVGLSGQMHGAVLLDAAERVLRPAILWNDGRSAQECIELERREPRLRAITGNLAMPGFTAPKLLWVAQHEPELFRSVATILLPKDYLRLRMTGEKLSDMSDASGTLWLDVGQRAWSDAMLAATGLSRSQMPALVEGNAAAGWLRPEAAAELGLPQTLVAGGAGDNAASAIGMGVIAPGQAFLSLGTSGVLFVVTDRFRPAPDQAAHAFCHALPASWHQMSVLLSATSALDWAVRLVGMHDVASAVATASVRGLHRQTPFFLPYLTGERTPHNDPSARGVFFGLGATTSSADLLVAVLEGVSLAFADGLDTLTRVGGDIGEISMVGGGARLLPWVEFLASALNRPLLLRGGGEVAAAVGAARLGRMAVTAEAPATVCIAPEITGVISPATRLAELMQQRRPQFKDLYQQLKRPFREFSA